MLKARETVNGGAYSVKLVKKLVRNKLRCFRGIGRLERGGSEVIEGKDVRGHHGNEEDEVETHREAHFLA